MIPYLITSALLSFMGGLTYLTLVRNRFSFVQQKSFIYVIVILSLGLPVIVQKHVSPMLMPNPYVAPMGFGEKIDPLALQSYCKCEHPNYHHRIHYRTNAYYNFILKYKFWINTSLGIAVGLVLIHFLLQLIYLQRIVNKGTISLRQLDNRKFWLLLPHKWHPVGAFWLGKRYVMWEEKMNSLPVDQQNAVLRHELSHLDQYNTVEKVAMRIIQCFWFWNPVFYLFRRDLDLLSECMADQAACRNFRKKEYAYLLLQLEKFKTSAFVSQFRGSTLKVRIKRLFHPLPNQPIVFFAVIAVVLFAFELLSVKPLHATVHNTLYEFETYEKIYQQTNSETSEAIFCPDCETVCTPEDQ